MLFSLLAGPIPNMIFFITSPAKDLEITELKRNHRLLVPEEYQKILLFTFIMYSIPSAFKHLYFIGRRAIQTVTIEIVEECFSV